LPALLEVKNITVHYGKSLAVEDISLEVAEGSVVSIIGANGAGKSTILKAISGLVHLTSGEIWFLGKRIDGLSTTDIVKLGIVQIPEGRHLFPYLTVSSNLKLGASLRNDKAGINQDMARVFELFPRLEERRNQKAGTLSGGEQQMLTIARALMSRPKLLMLDEPSLGLMPTLVNEVFQIVKEIHAEGTTILLVEQNARKALGVADRGYVLETGSIVLQGAAEDLRNNDDVRKVYLGEE
jgi:branched-chain amino acid transport system ATP-binding protein